MTFEDWWDKLSAPEQKMIGVNNARFVWQECQKYTLMTIEEACKAQTAYEQGFKDGFKDGEERYRIQIGGWTLTPGMMPGMIWITAANGEGGDFHIHELADAISKFYWEKF